MTCLLPASIRAHLAALDAEIERAALRRDFALRDVLLTSKAFVGQLARARDPVDRLLDALRLWRWQRGTTLSSDTRIAPNLPLTGTLIEAALNRPYGDAAPATGADSDPAGSADAANPEEGSIAKAGLDLIAVAKTEALRTAIMAQLKLPVAPYTMLRRVLLALAASNITMRPHDIDYEEIVGRLVGPAGEARHRHPGDLAGIVAQALLAILRIGGPSTYGMNASGDAAEWIGALIDAGAQLPRFDTEEFLKHVKGSALVDLAEGAGIKTTGTVSTLRARLVGQLPNWRPYAAQFGAPGPAHE